MSVSIEIRVGDSTSGVILFAKLGMYQANCLLGSTSFQGSEDAMSYADELDIEALDHLKSRLKLNAEENMP